MVNHSVHPGWIGSTNVSFTRGSGSGVPTREFEPSRVAEAVVYAVADAAAADPLSIEPLYESIDPDALSALVRSGSDDLVVSFSHHGVPVDVFGDGTVRVVTGTVG